MLILCYSSEKYKYFPGLSGWAVVMFEFYSFNFYIVSHFQKAL